MNSFRLLLVCVATTWFLLGCDASKEPEKKAKPTITPEQSACFDAVLKKQIDLENSIMKRYGEAVTAGQSTIALTLEKRRSNEQICLEEMNCSGTKEILFLSYRFDSCLKESEQSGG